MNDPLSRRRLGALALSLLGAAACGDDSVSARDKKVRRTTVPSSTTTTVSPPVGQPTRIVSLSPTHTETLFAIGAGSQVVAVDRTSTYPLQAPVSDLDVTNLNIELLTSFQPDLVILEAAEQSVLDQLNVLDIAVLDLPIPRSLNGSFEQIERVGAVTGNIASAAQLVANFETRVQALLASFPDQTGHLRYYLERDPNFSTAASKTFIGAVFGLLDMRSIADAVDTGRTAGYPQLTSDYIVKANPDVILLADTQCCQESLDTLAARPGWSDLRAVAEGHVILLADDVASRRGPRTVDMLVSVADKVRDIEPHPDDTLSS
jgi:iron complex transport system substrate-binding protein